jgi:hypothetical protein
VAVSEHSFTVGESTLEKRDRLVESPGRLVSNREAVPRQQRVGVVVAQDSFPVGETGFV